MFGGEASIQVFDTDAAVPAGVQTASLVAHRPTPPVNPRSAPAHDRYAPRRPPLPLANSLHLPGPDSPSYVNRRRMSPEAPKETRSRTVSPGAMDAASLSFSHHETPMYITHTHTHTHTHTDAHTHASMYTGTVTRRSSSSGGHRPSPRGGRDQDQRISCKPVHSLSQTPRSGSTPPRGRGGAGTSPRSHSDSHSSSTSTAASTASAASATSVTPAAMPPVGASGRASPAQSSAFYTPRTQLSAASTASQGATAITPREARQGRRMVTVDGTVRQAFTGIYYCRTYYRTYYNTDR